MSAYDAPTAATVATAATPPAPRPGGSGRPWPTPLGSPEALVAGAAILGVALGLTYVAYNPALQALMLLGVALAVAVVIGTPLLIGALTRADHVQADDALQDERRRIAAHLHDSVLQTLALVQRQADYQAAKRAHKKEWTAAKRT